MKELAEADDPSATGWMDSKHHYGAEVTGGSVAMWRALRSFTEGEAASIVAAVAEENGFVAWNKLQKHYAPTLATQQSAALTEYLGTANPPAKNPTDEAAHCGT